jgi:hypothetical protein
LFLRADAAYAVPHGKAHAQVTDVTLFPLRVESAESLRTGESVLELLSDLARAKDLSVVATRRLQSVPLL